MLKDNSAESPLVIIGDEDIVLGFKALGFKVYAIKEQSEFKSILEEVVRQNCAVCIMQDNIYNLAQGQINTYRNLMVPIFIPFSKTDQTDLLDNIFKDIRIRATGAF